MRHVMYDEERMRLLENLQAVFTQEVFDRAYPGVPLPVSVSIGGDTANPPFEVIVRELPTGVTNTKLSTCADITSEFNIELDLVASGSTIIDCTRTLLVYCDVIHQVCMADPFFDGDVLREPNSARPILRWRRAEFGSLCHASRNRQRWQLRLRGRHADSDSHEADLAEKQGSGESLVESPSRKGVTHAY